MSFVPISVIIPVFNASSRLETLCSSLARLEPPPQEILFVDDGSTDQTLIWLQNRVGTGIGQSLVKIISQTNSGPAAARNQGVRAATCDWIAFTDDDCLPSPGWLGAFYCKIQQAPNLVVAFGRVEALGEKNFLSHYVENFGEGHQTANALYHRETVLDLGGFDENFRTPYLEDTDLYLRASSKGEVDYVDSALVYHPTRPTTIWAKARRVKMYQNDFILHRKDANCYRRRHRGLGPLAYLLYYVCFKHALATLWAYRHCLFTQKTEFLTVVVTLALERTLLVAFLLQWTLSGKLQSPQGDSSSTG